METETTTQSKNSYLIPASILIAGVLVAGAVFLSRGGGSSAPVAPTPGSPAETASVDDIEPVTADEHILGDPNAPVKLVEFSDLECPFCKRFHQTITNQALPEYISQGKLAWVYRHFPLSSIHPKAARPASVASECAAELGGNFTFWAFVDRYFEITPSNDQMDLAKLPTIATDVGLDRGQFDSCFAGGEEKYGDKIDGQYQDAVSSGGQGTPYSVLIAANGQKFPITGAVDYAQLKEIIEQALAAK